MTTLETTTVGPVTTLTLSGLGRRNPLTPALLSAIVSACDDLRTRDDVRVVVLRGAGGFFSGGADLMSFMAAFQTTDRTTVADLGRRAGEALASLPQITVAFVEGHCVGGGVVLAAACDLRWAAEGAWFSIPELDIGMPLTWGALPRLVQLLGESRALDLVLSGELAKEVVLEPRGRCTRHTGHFQPDALGGPRGLHGDGAVRFGGDLQPGVGEAVPAEGLRPGVGAGDRAACGVREHERGDQRPVRID